MLDNPKPALTDGTVALRGWTAADLGCVRAASGEARIREVTSVPERFTAREGKAWIRRQQEKTRTGRGWSLAIADRQTAEAFGCVVLMLRPQEAVAGIGYWVVPEARKRGYATGAVGLLTTWGLGAGGLERVEAWVEPGNDASVRVLSRCGFGYEGRLRSFLRFPTRRTDALVFSRIRETDSGTRPPTSSPPV